ncbi:MAG: hypothetical protein IKL43_04705, partial [Alistipes sp.]|nr:hypothetical protein [Alistipes sp.]
MIFTQEELNTLKEADSPLRKYHFGKYVTGCSLHLARRLLDIYRRVTNDRTYICTSCSGGLATIFKTLAPMYLEELEKIDSKPKRQANGKRAIQSIRG